MKLKNKLILAGLLIVLYSVVVYTVLAYPFSERSKQPVNIKSEFIKVQLKVQDAGGNGLKNFPIAVHYDLSRCGGGPNSEYFKTVKTNQNGTVILEICSNQNVYVSSGNPDWRIDDQFCKEEENTDCRYSVMNFGKEYGIYGHRLSFSGPEDVKSIKLKIVMPRLGDFQYYKEDIYAKCLANPNEVCTEGWEKLEDDYFGFRIKYPSLFIDHINNLIISNISEEDGRLAEYVFSPNTPSAEEEEIIDLVIYPGTTSHELISNSEKESRITVGNKTVYWSEKNSKIYYFLQSDSLLFSFNIKLPENIAKPQKDFFVERLRAVVSSFEGKTGIMELVKNGGECVYNNMSEAIKNIPDADTSKKLQRRFFKESQYGIEVHLPPDFYFLEYNKLLFPHRMLAKGKTDFLNKNSQVALSVENEIGLSLFMTLADFNQAVCKLKNVNCDQKNILSGLNSFSSDGDDYYWFEADNGGETKLPIGKKLIFVIRKLGDSYLVGYANVTNEKCELDNISFLLSFMRSIKITEYYTKADFTIINEKGKLLKNFPVLFRFPGLYGPESMIEEFNNTNNSGQISAFGAATKYVFIKSGDPSWTISSANTCKVDADWNAPISSDTFVHRNQPLAAMA